MNKAEFVANTTSLPIKKVVNTVGLLEQDCTIPFISRYRKEVTGNLDEVAVMNIFKAVIAYEEIEKRKITISKAIEEQELLTVELQEKIKLASSIIELEDIYLPFKKKRTTKAARARKNGLEPLAKIIMKQQDGNIHKTAHRFISHSVENAEEALEGARFIIAEWINENTRVRNRLRSFIKRTAVISSKVLKTVEEEQGLKYKQYFDWNEPLVKCPSHRLLAILRAEKEGVVKVKIVTNKDEALKIIDQIVIKTDVKSCTEQVFLAIEDSWKRLLLPALSNEILKEAKEKADESAIKVFATNLRQLLLAAPLGEKRILAIDPGYKSGCKIVCLDEKGDLLHNENIYPHPPQRETGKASKKIRSLVNAYKIQAIAIGNGTASRETESFIKRIAFDHELQVFVVNENGASIYSASRLAREEFPNYDVTVRGAVSIGRRLADPLAELVKIDPKSIGVGQYQHDVDQTKLKNELDTVVESCVNKVGVNVNTASAPLLSYVSGIGAAISENIVKYRTEHGAITSRKELLKIPRLGNKVFEQAAAFLRITDPENPLDNSAVHPERYWLISKMAKDQNTNLENLIGNKEIISKIKLSDYTTDEIGIPTLEDIIKELVKPGRDPRKKAKVFEFSKEIKTINDVNPGMRIPGIVNNITNFGCFVDIGIKESGLVHISKLKKEYVSDPAAVVSLHQHVEVKVLEVDSVRKRIQLSMID
jgi:uncharacterized protein